MTPLTLGDVHDALMASYSQMIEAGAQLRAVLGVHGEYSRASVSPIPDDEQHVCLRRGETNRAS